MSLVEPPEDAVETGRIEITLFVSDGGDQEYEFALDGLTGESAVGYLLVVADRIRDIQRMEWESEDEWEDE